MERYSIAKTNSRDVRQSIRNTRQLLATMFVDTPLKLAVLFILMSGVEEGLLKLVHEEKFSENAWFYLSRHIIWGGFFLGAAMDMTAGLWLKTQRDKLLQRSGVFEKYPSKEDLKKRFGYSRYYWKQFTEHDNKIKRLFPYDLFNIVIPNFLPALFLYSFIHMASIGRVDFDIYFNDYLVSAFYCFYCYSSL